MSNILCVYEGETITVSILREIFEKMFFGTSIKYDFKADKSILPNDIDEANVLFLIRSQDFLSHRLVKKAQKSGCFVVLFIDDNLFSLPKDMPSIPWRKTVLQRNLRSADMLVSSSPYICKLYEGKTRQKRGASISTIVSEDELSLAIRKREEKDCVKLVYAAGGGHEEFFMKYIHPILPELNRKYGKQISITFVGVHPEMCQEDYAFKVNYIKSMPLKKYRQFMRKMDYDIGLAPLENNSFNKCKYFNKYIEYSLVGVVGIYSKCKPYTYVIEDEKNGFFADDNEESWFKAICKAIDSEELRNRCLVNAVDQLRSDFNPLEVRENFLRNMPEVFRKKESGWRCNTLFWAHVVNKLYRLADTIYLFIFYLRRIGIIGVFKRVQECK